MVKRVTAYALLAGFLVVVFPTADTAAFQLIDRISSDHLILQMPHARESLGRDTIGELERCYNFMNRAAGGSLPRHVFIHVSWEDSVSRCDRRDSAIRVGMNSPDKSADLGALLRHKAGREIARLSLLELSGWAQREDTEFLFEGMIEILFHEFERSSRSLESAWVYAKFLDEMGLLGLSTQRAWSGFAGMNRYHRNAAPGVTFLTTFRELQGRERPVKLFAALKKASLSSSLASTFKAPPAELERTWLKAVREYRTVDEITLFEEDAPELVQAEAVSETGPDAPAIRIRLLLRDRNSDLFPDGIFVKDGRTRRVLQAQASPEQDTAYVAVRIPVEADCPPGKYEYQVAAIDEAGNLRRWTRSYSVGRP